MIAAVQPQKNIVAVIREELKRWDKAALIGVGRGEEDEALPLMTACLGRPLADVCYFRVFKSGSNLWRIITTHGVILIELAQKKESVTISRTENHCSREESIAVSDLFAMRARFMKILAEDGFLADGVRQSGFATLRQLAGDVRISSFSISQPKQKTLLFGNFSGLDGLVPIALSYLFDRRGRPGESTVGVLPLSWDKALT
jgi:hypothetical protein